MMTFSSRGVYREWRSLVFDTFVFSPLLKPTRSRRPKRGWDLFTALWSIYLCSPPGAYVFVACSSSLKVMPALCYLVNQPMYCRCDKENIGDRTIDVSCYVTGPLTPSHAVFKSFQNNTSIVSLAFNTFGLTYKLDFVPTETLKHATNVERLKFSESNLAVLKRGSFNGLPTLSRLSLASNGIVALEEESIANLPCLRTLELGHNQLTKISAKVFRKLPLLEQLFLERNHIRWIEDLAFVELISLKELDLSDNNIVNLTEQTFKGLSEAIRLDLFRNNIQRLDARVFGGMPKLAELDLKYNRITEVDPLAFDGLLQLRTLYLSHNRLRALPAHMFVGAPNVMGLDLSQNQLLTITWRTLQDLKTIHPDFLDLSLTGNKFGCDCRLSWILQLVKVTRSEKFRRELQHVKCRFGEVLSPDGGSNPGGSTRVVKLSLKDLGCSENYELPELSSSRQGKSSELGGAQKALAGAFESRIETNKAGSGDLRSKLARQELTLADGPEVASQKGQTKWPLAQRRDTPNETVIWRSRDKNCAAVSRTPLVETFVFLLPTVFLTSRSQ